MSDSQWSRMPYATMGKPGEQIGLFDSYIGNIMKKLKNLDIADNTIVIFTSDNGPDGGPDRGVFKMYNKFNHMRMGMMRGNKGKIQKPFFTVLKISVIHQYLKMMKEIIMIFDSKNSFNL